ncbi:MAG: BlaI/MecI/CopY family transcriptional regulator [Phycisphaerae bacterium]|jgi:predicted transcriptional regulator
MARSIPHITEAEFRLMKVLWRLGAGTVRDVKTEIEKEAGENPAYTTIMTLLNQLAEKGALKVDRARQPYVYRPALRRESVLGERLTQFLQTVFDGQAGELVLRLAEQADLSSDDIKRIEAWIEHRERQS